MSFSDRFTTLFLKPSLGLAIGGVLTHLAFSVGLSFKFPGTKFVLLVDDYGVQSPVSLVEFWHAIENRPTVSFQSWWTDSEDLFCTLWRENTIISLEFGLDGTSDRQEALVVENLKLQFSNWARESESLALIIDRTGATADLPWREIVKSGSPIQPPYPSRMFLPLDSLLLDSIDHDFAQFLRRTQYFVEIGGIK